MKRLVGWLFEPLDQPTTWLRVIGWWELRRIPFNVAIGSYGIVCFIVFLWAIGTSGHLQPGEDAVEPIALLAAPFGINALYSLGWLVEVPARLLVPDLTPRFGPLLLKLGMGLGLALVSLPPTLWAGFRLLQMAGLAK